MKNNKISVGAWFACCVAILAIASLIVYSVNVASAGYFQGAAVQGLIVRLVIAIACEVVAFALGLLKVNGVAGKLVDIVIGACQIAAPFLIAMCLMTLAAARVEGLGFIYFSNADVAKEVQTPANLASAIGSIAAMICLAVSMLAGMVSAFLNIRKEA